MLCMFGQECIDVRYFLHVFTPIENVDDLMLHDSVIDAVAQGKFHIYPVATVEEGIEVLTGVRAGSSDAAGKFEEGTVFARVDQRLREMAAILKDYA